MSEIVSASFMLFSSVVVFLASLGILRFPDALTRMAAASKALSLGGVLAGLAALFHPELKNEIPQSLLFTIFLFVATPVASHLLGRAGILRAMPLAPQTKYNESKKWLEDAR